MIRPITDTLHAIGRGTYLDDAAEQLAALVQAVEDTGNAGKLLLEISIKKASRGGAMVVAGKITCKMPGDEPMEALLWATPEGNLLREDPTQAKLDLKLAPGAASAPPTDVKTVA